MVEIKGWGDSNFNNDPRQKLNLDMQPRIDDVYHSVLGNDIKIDRIEHPGDHVLDRRFAIDTIITLPTGNILTGQEKCLDTTFMTLTVEHYQNYLTQEKGDWYRLAAQFYFCGYVNKDKTGFDDWMIMNWAAMVLGTFNKKVTWFERSPKDGSHARASFKYVHFSKIPQVYIIARKPRW